MVKINSNTEFNFEYEGKAIFENVNNEVIVLNEMLESVDLPLMVAKRIYSITIELLYNTVYHGLKTIDKEKDLSFIVSKDKKSIYLTSSNYISHQESESFRNTLCHLNSLPFDELRKMKSHQIKNGGISEKGGAGLGLIDISMKSNNPVDMTFKVIDENTDWLTLEVKVDIV